MICDNYLIAMAYIYLKRVDCIQAQYTFFNFLVALFLSHEMEEDDLDIKQEIVRIAMGGGQQISAHSASFFAKRKTKLWTDLHFKTLVTKEECEQVMMTVLPGNYVWRRNRHDSHKGAAIPFHIKQTVYLNPRFRNDLYSFRCLYCEGIRFLAERERLRFTQVFAQNKKQYDAIGCRAAFGFRQISSRQYPTIPNWEE
jgi:hypothetical protein